MSQVLQLNRSFWKNFLSSSEKGGHFRVAKCATRCLPIVWKVQTTLTISPLEPNQFCDLILFLNSNFSEQKMQKSFKLVFTFICIMIWPFVYEYVIWKFACKEMPSSPLRYNRSDTNYGYIQANGLHLAGMSVLHEQSTHICWIIVTAVRIRNLPGRINLEDLMLSWVPSLNRCL